MESRPSDASSAARKVLIVEDEVLIGVLLEDMLLDLGYAVVGTASQVDEALGAIEAQQPDAVILDLNLNGKSAFPVADALLAKKVPFLFVTGYGEHGLPAAYQKVPALQKPFQQDSLEAKLAALFV